MMDISNIKIMETIDYEIFKTQQGNRPLLDGDIKKIEKKILTENLLQYHPILVSEDLEVIDGQHRLEVAKNNDLIIYFIIMSGRSSLKTTQVINTTGKSWTVKDFLNSYISLGHSQYIRFNEILIKYKFLTISQLVLLCSSNGKILSATDKFKNGSLLIKDEVLLLKTLEDISLYIVENLALPSKGCFQRFIYLSNLRGIKFDHKRMNKKINANIDIVKRIPNDCYLYADMLGELYNYQLRSKAIVNFNLRSIK